jgi:DNA-binding ferritin-like protein
MGLGWGDSGPTLQDEFESEPNEMSDSIEAGPVAESEQASLAPIEMLKTSVKSLLPLLYTLLTAYRFAHWHASGPNFYGDHLLFQRLYEDVNDEIDALSERVAGVFGIESGDNAKKLLSLSAFFSEGLMVVETAQGLLELERLVLQQIGKTMECWEKCKIWGLDELLLSIASKHQEHQYLLSRRVGTPLMKQFAKMVTRYE